MVHSTQRKRRLCVELLEPREMLSAASTDSLLAAKNTTVTDDYANTLAKATLISLSTTGTTSQSGKIETSGDVDAFKFTAATSGKVTIKELAANSRLDSYVYVYDSTGKLIASNDDYARSLNSCVTITATAGATYYIKAAAYGRSTGAYVLQITPSNTTVTDDYGNTMALATTISLSASGSATQTGKIETSSDVDMFKIVATATGTLTVTQTASSSSSLTSHLYVYDASGTLLGESNGTNASVAISVTAGTTYYIKAACSGTSTGAYTLGFTTAQESTDSEDGFQITTSISGMTAAEEAIVLEAIAQWEAIIVGDLSDVTYHGQVIDDISITISAISIDGEGSVLGQSAVTAVRSDSCLPYLGYIQLDTADVASMLSDGSLLAVLEHEIAHVLGFGSIWSALGLLTGSSTSNPGFTGTEAVAAYNALFGTSVTAVPVEADGGSGTALAHWDESVFDTELMTGWYDSGQTNALSIITIASMADLGYTVNYAVAESYTPPTTSSVTTASTSVRNSLRRGYSVQSEPAAIDTSMLLANEISTTTSSVIGSDAGQSTAYYLAANASDIEGTAPSLKSKLLEQIFYDSLNDPSWKTFSLEDILDSTGLTHAFEHPSALNDLVQSLLDSYYSQYGQDDIARALV